MGLGLYVGDERVGQWSYSGFNDFRRKLAWKIGLDLDNMEGFGQFNDDIEDQMPWANIKDPIVPLLHHSDCDGIITPEECATVGPRLAELIKDWPDTITFSTQPVHQAFGYPATMTIDDYDTIQARSLVEGMKRAAEEGLPLEFH